MGLMRLGLSNPSANTDVAIYTATGPFLASIIATNKSASATSNIRIWIVPDGATLTSQYAYLAYDQDIVPQNSLETHRFALNQNDVVYVRADTADMSFIINGLKQVDIALAAGVTSYSNTPPVDVMDGMIWVDKDGNGTALNTLAGQVIQANSTTEVPLTVRGLASQTADIFDVQNSTGSDLLTVNKDGIVRMPSQPAFLATKSDDGNQLAAGTYPFNVAVINTGGHYSTSQFRFTAPVAGKYFFTYGIQLYGVGDTTNVITHFMKNGSQYPAGDTSTGFRSVINKVSTAYHNTATLSGVIDLAAADYVSVYHSGSRGMQSHFSGYLIG